MHAREGGHQRLRQSIPALPVRRANPCAAHSLLRLGTGPSPPWLGRSPGRASTGHSPYSGSPTGLLSFSGSPIARSPYFGSAMASRFGREKCHGHFSFVCLTPVGDGLRIKCWSCPRWKRTVSPHFLPAIYCGRVSRSLFPTRLYLLHPWSRTRVYGVALGECAQRSVSYASAHFPSRALYPRASPRPRDDTR